MLKLHCISVSITRLSNLRAYVVAQRFYGGKSPTGVIAVLWCGDN